MIGKKDVQCFQLDPHLVSGACAASYATVLKKIFGQIGTIREGGMLMPMEGGKTKGFAFIEFLTPAEAQAAQEQTNGYRLDKAHVFNVTMFDDFEKFAKVKAVQA